MHGMPGMPKIYFEGCMKKFVKRILLAVGALLLLLVVAVGIVLAVVDPNDYRDEISEAAYQATGRQIELAGPISLKIFPRLGISAEDVKLAAAQGGSEKPLLSLHELSLRMAILPLLTGSVQIDTVVLDGLTVNLLTDKNGVNNWDVPAAAGAKPVEAPKESEKKEDVPLTPEEAEKRVNAILSSRISAIIITNCSVSYINQQAGQDYLLRLKTLSLKDVGLDRDIACALDVEAEDRKAAMQGALALEGSIRYMLREQDIFFDLRKVTLSGVVPQLEGRQQLDGSFKGKMGLADMAGALEATIKHNNAGIALNTTFGLEPGIKAEGKLALDAKPAALMRMLKIEGAPAGASPLDTFTGSAAFAFADNLIKVGNLDLKLGNNDLTVKSPGIQARLDDTGKSAYPVSALSMQLEAGAVPASFIKMAGLALTPPQGHMQTLALSTKVDLNGSVITIAPFELDLDKKTMLLSVPKLTLVQDATGKSAIPLAKAQGSLSLTGNPAPYMQMAGAGAKGGQTFSKLDAGLKLDLNGSDLKINDFKVLLDKDLLAFTIPSFVSRLNLSKDALFPMSTLSASASIKAKPRTLMDMFGVEMETSDPNVLRDFSASLGLDLSNGQLKINGLKANLDTTTLSGTGDILLPGAKNLPKGSLASVKSNLQLGVLNLDRYLAPEKAEDKKAGQQDDKASEGQTGSKPASEKGPLQDSPLAKVYADLTLGMQKLTVKKADIEKINLQITMDKGVVTLKKGQLNAFNGSLNATARAALAQPKPDMAVTASLQKLNLGKALVTFANENRLDGAMDANVNVTFKGLDGDSILKTLNGKGKLDLKNGAVQNMSLIPAGIGGDLGKYSQSRYEFRDVDASFTFIDGKLVNDHVNASGVTTRLEGVGSIILATGELDYKGAIYGKNGEELPILAGGPVNKLWVKVDTEGVAKIAARKASEKAKEELQKKAAPVEAKAEEKKQEVQRKVDTKVTEQKERAEEKVNTGIQKGLDKLFKR